MSHNWKVGDMAILVSMRKGLEYLNGEIVSIIGIPGVFHVFPLVDAQVKLSHIVRGPQIYTGQIIQSNKVAVRFSQLKPITDPDQEETINEIKEEPIDA